MNLQQLNNNGKQFWVFLITAVVALFLTFFAWLLIEQFQKPVFFWKVLWRLGCNCYEYRKNTHTARRQDAEGLEEYSNTTHIGVTIRGRGGEKIVAS